MKTQSWLNTSFYERLLNGAKILKTSVNEAVPKGDHYFSTLLRANVQYLSSSPDSTPCTSNFIIKTYPDGVMKDFMIESGAMKREVTMYEKVMPMLNKISNRELSPNTYDVSIEDVLIMEDLVSIGYCMEDRIKQMDFDHCKFAIEALADFHGASIVLNSLQLGLIQTVGKEVLYTEENDYMKAFIINCFKVLGNEVKSWPCSSKYSTKLLESGDKVWEDMVSAMVPLDNDILVLNHGDFWTNNMLFHHNENGETDDVKFIDFQFCRWSSPAFDLHRFLHTSVRDMTHVNELVVCYTDRLNGFLKERNVPVEISEKQMSDILRRMQCYALISTACLLPTCVQSRDKPLDYDGVTRADYNASFESTNPYVDACKGARFRQIVPERLDKFHKMGML